MSQSSQLSQIKIPESENPRVVIIGGGFAGLKLAQALKNQKVQVVLFDKQNYHTFQPLLYQVATAGLEPDSIAGPLRQLISYKKDFYFRMATVNRVDPAKKLIETSIGVTSYDFLVIATGAETNFFGNDEIASKAYPLKGIPDALDLRSHILRNFEKAVLTSKEKELQSLMNYVVVGGGPTGVEVSGALGELKQHVLPKDYPDLDFRKMEIYLIEGAPRLLNGMSETASDRAFRYLKKFDVVVHIKKMVKSFDGNLVDLSDGTRIPSKTLIWAAGVKPTNMPGLEVDLQGGRIPVDQFNQVIGEKDVFALGDMSFQIETNYPNGHPMLASVAQQQGVALGKNLTRILKGKTPVPFNYVDKGTLATIGRNRAVADFPGNIKVGGRLGWFIWMFVHIMLLVGFRNKLVVLSNWIWNYFTYDRGTRLIVRPFSEKDLPDSV